MKRKLSSLVLILVFSLNAGARPGTHPRPTLSDGRQVAESAANSRKLEEAGQLFDDKEYAKAEEAYKALRAGKLQKSTWGMASHNLGLVLKVEKKYDDAIEVFQSILDSDVNDRDQGEHVMENFRNYRHKAAIQIARCYEAKGDIPKALEFVELARTKYVFQAHCGNCADDVEASRGKFEKRLLEKMEKSRQAGG